MTGLGLRDAVLLIVGNLVVAILAVKAIGAWTRNEWGELLGLVAGAALIGGIAWFPDQAIDLLKWVWGLITGNGKGA